MCFSGVVYARHIQGRTLTFGVSGKLIRNALVMYDRETESLWSQFYSLAVEGAYDGVELEVVSGRITRWSEWRDLYPGTRVLDQSGRRFTPCDTYARDRPECLED